LRELPERGKCAATVHAVTLLGLHEPWVGHRQSRLDERRSYECLRHPLARESILSGPIRGKAGIRTAYGDHTGAKAIVSRITCCQSPATPAQLRGPESGFPLAAMPTGARGR